MGLQDFRKDKGTAGSAAAAGMGTLTAFIDQGSEFSGKLSFKDTVRIDGRFEGEISSDNTLIVGETGEIRAKIQSEVVIVSGLVEGDVIARRQIVLHKTARVSGNIQTASIAVEEGASLNGQVSMGSPRDKAAGRSDAKGKAPEDAKGRSEPLEGRA